MLTAFAEIVKAALVPGSQAFLLLAGGIGVALLYFGKSSARLGRRWLTTLAVVYLVLALPVVATTLIASLELDVPQITKPEDARGARVLVVVGNGVVTYTTDGREIHQFLRRTAYAALEGARIYALIKPEWVITSGGIPNPDSQSAPESEVIRDELVRLGVPKERILLESGSRNTSQQIANIAGILREKAILGPIVLVTTPAHSRRALTLADREDLELVPSMADALRYDSGVGGWRDWVPSVGALRGSESAIYEYLALVYEWIKALRPTAEAAAPGAGR